MWRRALFRLKERWAHPQLENILSEMRYNDRIAQNELRDLQRKLISQTLRDATNCPYYRRLFEEHKIDCMKPECLSKIPVLTKTRVETHLSELCNPLYRGRMRLCLSSGSTGTPGHFYRTTESICWAYASGMRCMERFGIEPGERTLRLWGRGSQFSPSIKTRAKAHFAAWKDWAVGVYNLCAYNLSPERIRQEWKAITRWKPRVVHGYTTAIVLLAKYVKENDFDGRALGVSTAIVESEKLYPEQRSLIEEVFGCRVLEWYGACEVGVIATPCSLGRLHIREDMVYLEIIDGSIVATSLRERGMPLIRYSLGDEGILDPNPCSCGMPMAVLKEIEGRTCDVIRGVDGRSVHGAAIFHIMHQLPNVRKFKVVQKTLELCEVLVETKSVLTKDEKKRVLAQFRGQLGGKVSLRFQEVEQLPTEKSGKFRWIVSEM